MTCDAAGTVAAIRAVAATVAEHKVELTHLDREIGDGDHGENLARGFSAVIDQARRRRTPETPGAVLKLVATTLISTVGGASGPLFGTAFLRASTAVGDAATLDGAAVVAALDRGPGRRGRPGQGRSPATRRWWTRSPRR